MSEGRKRKRGTEVRTTHGWWEGGYDDDSSDDGGDSDGMPCHDGAGLAGGKRMRKSSQSCSGILL